MNDPIGLIVMATLIIIGFNIFLMESRDNRKQRAREIEFIENQKYKQKEKQKSKATPKTKSDEIIDTLDWMLANQIITASEYNKLMVKCLPLME